MKSDVYIKLDQLMFEYLVSGKEVVVEQSDGSKWHFILEDMGWDQMLKAITKAACASSQNDQDFDGTKTEFACRCKNCGKDFKSNSPDTPRYCTGCY